MASLKTQVFSKEETFRSTKEGRLNLGLGRTSKGDSGEDVCKFFYKSPHLRRLNEDPGIVARRIQSRKSHDLVVQWLADKLRQGGCRVFTLSEYIKERRIPDAIVFDGTNMIALEVETEKRWKPSRPSTEDRLSRLNALSSFFDKTKVVFPSPDDSIDKTGPAFLKHILS